MATQPCQSEPFDRLRINSAKNLTARPFVSLRVISEKPIFCGLMCRIKDATFVAPGTRGAGGIFLSFPSIVRTHTHNAVHATRSVATLLLHGAPVFAS